jgi:hypothetical protein
VLSYGALVLVLVLVGPEHVLCWEDIMMRLRVWANLQEYP